jgi:HlyD family secretion protein
LSASEATGERLEVKRTSLAIVVIVLVVIAVVLAIYQSRAPKESKFVTVPIERGILKLEVSSTGTLQPINLVEVGSQVSGGIKEVYVDVESRVKKGELLALVDPAPFEVKVTQARASLDAAKGSLLKTETSFEEAMKTYRRKKALLADNSIPEHEYDTAKTVADNARIEVDIQKATIVESEGRLQESLIELKNCRIESPLDGVIVMKKAGIGQTLAATYQTPVLFKIAEDLSRMRINANVDEADIGLVKVGQNVLFRVPAFPRETFTGIVRDIWNDPTTKNNIVTYTVVIDVSNTDLHLRPGMTSNVTIVVGEVEDALIVPEQALHFSPDNGTKVKTSVVQPNAGNPGEGSIWKLLPNGTLEQVMVKIGMAGLDKVQIFSDGVAPGDLVVVELAAEKKSET